MRANFRHIGIDLQSSSLGLDNCINVLIRGGVKLTEFLEYTYNGIATAIGAADVIATSHFQSCKATFWKNPSGGGCAAGTWPPAKSASATLPAVTLNASRRILNQVGSGSRVGYRQHEGIRRPSGQDDGRGHAKYHIQSASDGITIFLVIVFRVINKFSVCFTRRLGNIIHNVCNAIAGLRHRDGTASRHFVQ
jgi:hypothetical protein